MKNKNLKALLFSADNIVKVLVVVSVFCLISVLAHNALHDLDIWLHLKAGEYIAAHKAVPTHDIFSFTLDGKPWVDHEWLFQVVIYLVNSYWQADGLIFLESLIIVLAFLVLFITGYRKTGYYLESAALLVLTAYASINRFNIRPEIFSLSLFALYLYILNLHWKSKFIWFLVPLQIIWVNLHGYFFLGPLLIFFFILAEVLRRHIKGLPLQWRKEGALSDVVYLRFKRLLAALILTAFLNPNSPEGALYPAYVLKDFLTGENKIFFKYIQELQPTFSLIKASQFYCLYVLIGLCLMAMLVNWRRLKIIEIILFLFFLPFAFTMRNVAFFSFICYVITITYIVDTLNRLSGKVKLSASSGKTSFVFLRHCLAIIFVAWIGLKIDKIVHSRTFEPQAKIFKNSLMGIDQSRYPKEAVDFVLTNNLPGNMFNDFNSGAYLIGRAYPRRKVFIDGRTEAYGKDFFRKYIEIMEGSPALFEEIVKQYQIKAVLLSLTSANVPQIVNYLYKSPYWKLVFFDDSAVVFLKDSPENQELIKKFTIDLSQHKAPVADIKAIGLIKSYPHSYIKRANLFEIMQEDNAEISESLEALRIMPDCAQAYNLLGKVFYRKKLYEQALFNFRAACILAPNNLNMLVDVANVLSELKDKKPAIIVLKGVIKSNKHYAPAYYSLGRIYLSLDDENKAISLLARAVTYSQNNPEYAYKFAEALYVRGRKNRDDESILKSKHELDKALRLAIMKQDVKLLVKIKNKLRQIVGTH